jgi:hypothetical protein
MVLESSQPIKYIVMDPEYVSLELNPRNVRVQQTITWHDLRMTVLMARILLGVTDPRDEDGGDWHRRLRLADVHALPILYNLCSFGRLQVPLKIWIDHLTPEQVAGQRRQSNGRAGDGFRNYTDMVNEAPTRPDAMLADHDVMFTPEGKKEHERHVGIIANMAQISGEPQPDTVVGLSDMQRQADERGVAIVFILGPVLFDAHAELYRAHDAGVIRAFVPFNHPAQYPDLYKYENQFDMRHLNAEGSEIYTRLVAEKFVENLKAARPQPAPGPVR